MAPKRRKGDRRIDAAIDHFVLMGYTTYQVRTAVNALLKGYGVGAAAWPFLEDASYLLVQERLLEMENEEKELLPPPLEQETQEEEEPEPEQEQTQHQEPAVPPQSNRSNSSILEGHNVEPAGIESSDEEVEDPMLIEPHALEVVAPLAEAKAVVPLAEATGTGETRRPCYGWLSESEDEEEQTSEQHEVHLLSPGSIRKRKSLE